MALLEKQLKNCDLEATLKFNREAYCNQLIQESNA